MSSTFLRTWNFFVVIVCFGWEKKPQSTHFVEPLPSHVCWWSDLHTDFLQPSLATVDMEPRAAHGSQIFKIKMRWILLRWIDAVDLQTLQKLDVLQRRRQSDSQHEEQDGDEWARELHHGTPGDGVGAAGLTQLMVLQENHQNICVNERAVV